MKFSMKIVYILTLMLSLAAAGHADDYALHDNISSNWIDLGHWIWHYSFDPNCIYQGCKGAEVYYVPSSVVNEQGVGAHLFRDVLIKVVWGHGPESGKGRYSSVEYDSAPPGFFNGGGGIDLWQIAFDCDNGSNGYGMSRWYADDNGRLTSHGSDLGPFYIQPESIEAVLKPIVCP